MSMTIEKYCSLFGRKYFAISVKIALLIWLWLIFDSFIYIESTHVHGDISHHVHKDIDTKHPVLLAMNSIFSMHWLLMLLSMMLPLLFISIEEVVKNNFKRKVKINLSLFFIGYVIFWAITSIVLITVSFYLNKILSNQLLLGFLFLLISILWQCTPYKKYFLNRCHLPAKINPFGIRSSIDSFTFGIKKSFYCVGTCWPIMWICLVWMQPTMLIMPFLTIFLLDEQLSPRRYEKWGLINGISFLLMKHKSS